MTVLQFSPQIVMSVNVNGSLGQTFQASFAYSNSPLPTLNNVYPNGTNLFQSTNTLAFNALSAVGIPASNITVTLNGIQVTNLVLSGSSTNWNVSYPYLRPNTLYTAVITVMDANGNIATTTKSFDTFSASNYTFEAEDFDYGGGHFIDNPQTKAFAGMIAQTNIDTHQANFGGKDLYRPNGMDTEVNGDVVRAPFNGTGYQDYSIGYFSAGAWANYTRHYPAGGYNAYARLASGGSATTCALYQVTGGWGTTSQSTNFLGTFSVPLTAWETYNYIPLQDTNGNLVTISLNGSTNTLRLMRPSSASSDCNANFLMLVPVFNVTAARLASNILLSIPTQSGFNYLVQYKHSLTDSVWNTLTDLPGNNATQSISDSLTSGARFYRVQIH